MILFLPGPLAHFVHSLARSTTTVLSLSCSHSLIYSLSQGGGANFERCVFTTANQQILHSVPLMSNIWHLQPHRNKFVEHVVDFRK